MKSKKHFQFLAVLAAVLIWTAPVKAISIPLIYNQGGPNEKDSGWAMQVRSELLEGGRVFRPDVYGIIDDAVVIQLDKVFDRPFDQSGFNYPIIIEFAKTSSSDATSKIIIRDEWIKNNTNLEWTDYHMHLIVDPCNPEAGFDPNPDFLIDGDQLEYVYYGDYDAGYNGLPINLEFEDVGEGGVPSVPDGDDVFQPGYYGGQIVIVTNPQMGEGDFFALKERPTPEPATLLLLGLGGLMTIRRKGKST